jgi:hypothetical protein
MAAVINLAAAISWPAAAQPEMAAMAKESWSAWLMKAAWRKWRIFNQLAASLSANGENLKASAAMKVNGSEVISKHVGYLYGRISA